MQTDLNDKKESFIQRWGRAFQIERRTSAKALRQSNGA